MFKVGHILETEDNESHWEVEWTKFNIQGLNLKEKEEIGTELHMKRLVSINLGNCNLTTIMVPYPLGILDLN